MLVGFAVSVVAVVEPVLTRLDDGRPPQMSKRERSGRTAFHRGDRSLQLLDLSLELFDAVRHSRILRTRIALGLGASDANEQQKEKRASSR